MITPDDCLKPRIDDVLALIAEIDVFLKEKYKGSPGIVFHLDKDRATADVISETLRRYRAAGWFVQAKLTVQMKLEITFCSNKLDEIDKHGRNWILNMKYPSPQDLG